MPTNWQMYAFGLTVITLLVRISIQIGGAMKTQETHGLEIVALKATAERHDREIGNLDRESARHDEAIKKFHGDCA